MIGISELRAQRSTHVGTIDVGKSEIEQHEIDAVHRSERLAARSRDRDGKAFALETFREGRHDRVLVLDDEQPRSVPRRVAHLTIVTRRARPL